MSDLGLVFDAKAVDATPAHAPDFHVFRRFLDRCRGLKAITVAACWPVTDVALTGTTEAAEAGLILPILVGPAAQITELAASLNLDIRPYRIIEAPTEALAAAASVALCRSGEC